eukprot:Seg270.5 transcript_id=Seg270.5/GoldUCD/mRNA.D3Y31 product="hypothetical protein" protein_id=Seg270.5/GoldUCD/D3Y31
MDHERIKRELLNEGADYLLIKWKRNPPSASHMGGIWERQIRSVRAILSALFQVHGTSLNDEALRTFMAEATGILNSRPLTVDNLNSPDCLPLSPNNLLTIKTKVILPPPGNFSRVDMYSRKYWRRVQHLADEFGKDGAKNICRISRREPSGTIKEIISKLETSYLSFKRMFQETNGKEGGSLMYEKIARDLFVAFA